MKGNVRMGPVYVSEKMFLSGIQRGDHKIGRAQRIPYLRKPQKRPIRQDGNRNIGDGLDGLDEAADSGVKRGLSRTRDRDVVGLTRQMGLQLFEDVSQRRPLLSLSDLIGRSSKLTVDAIIGAGLERNKINAKRPAQTS